MQDSGDQKGAESQAVLKLAECLAGTSPKEAMQQLENIPRPQRSLRMLVLLGKLYRRCNYKEAAIETFKVL